MKKLLLLTLLFPLVSCSFYSYDYSHPVSYKNNELELDYKILGGIGGVLCLSFLTNRIIKKVNAKIVNKHKNIIEEKNHIVNNQNRKIDILDALNRLQNEKIIGFKALNLILNNGKWEVYYYQYLKYLEHIQNSLDFFINKLSSTSPYSKDYTNYARLIKIAESRIELIKRAINFTLQEIAQEKIKPSTVNVVSSPTEVNISNTVVLGD